MSQSTALPDDFNHEHLVQSVVSLGVVTGFDPEAAPDEFTTGQYRVLIRQLLHQRSRGHRVHSRFDQEELEAMCRIVGVAEGGTNGEKRRRLAEAVSADEDADHEKELRKSALQPVAMHLAAEYHEMNGGGLLGWLTDAIGGGR